MDFTVLPEPFRARTEQRWRELGFTCMPEALLETAPGVLAWSEFVGNVLRNQSGLLTEAWLDRVQNAVPNEQLKRDVERQIAAANDEAGLMRVLRQVRQAEHARLAWRDIAGWAGNDEVLAAVTTVADACIQGALARLHEWHREAHGDARDADGNALELIVLGMGKLGGSELNFSSDIDLIFAFEANGESDGRRPLSNEQYFARLGQKLIRVLDEVTADGFAYRVDMRLRPFGDGGPLVMTMNGTEAYYEQHGREWERYAFVKARPVAGDLEAGAEMLRRLQPFVYRRYLDFGVFESLREMKAAISAEVQRRELRDHVKLGPGGIREAEFVVQLFQLIRGGREPELRARNFHEALAAAVERDCLSEDDGAALGDAYDFLRRLENRLQEAADQQVHTVPSAGPERELLAFTLGFDGEHAFSETWRHHRDVIRTLFEQAFLGPEPRPAASPLEAAWQQSSREGRAALERAGFTDVDALSEQLAALKARIEKHPPGAQGLRKLNQLMPRLIATASRHQPADAALERMLKLVEAVLGRTTYLALLLENPRALDQLARVCAASDWIAQLVARHPLLLDELIDPRLFEDVPSRQSLQADLETHLARHSAGDLEGLMDALREFQQVSVMRIAAADISGTLPVMHVSDRLTDVAELVIDAVLHSAESHLVSRHGEPGFRVNGDRRGARFLVVGYGKLGGLELGYGSDLDLVFLHDSQGEDQHTDGERPLDNAVFFLRLTQRLIHLLSTPTSAGTLYDVDTRLRPSGQAGLLVSSLEAFTKYQREQAWTWEHQALLRARAVAGDVALAKRFAELRHDILARPRDPVVLRAEVASMRARMQGEAVRTSGDDFDLKAGRGGITDIEFLAQYWVLREAHAAPDLLAFTDTIRFLEGLESCGCVPADRLGGLTDAYRALRAAAHACALQGRPAVISAAKLVEARRRVADVWESEFGDAGQGDA